MALPPLALASELATRTGRPAGDQRLVAAITDASRRFRAAVSHDVSLVTGEVLELDGPGSRTILLPAAPVVSVTELRLLDSGLVLVERVDFSVGKKAGLLRRLGGRYWPDELGFASITYTHGYSTTLSLEGTMDLLPEDIQGAVLDMAQILLNVTPGVQSKTVLGDTVAFGAAASVGVTQSWTEAVENHQLHKGDRA